MTFWELLAFHERSTLWLWETIPTPLSDSTTTSSPEAPMKVRVAEAEPLDCGTNVTQNPWLPPGGIVNGKESPLRINSGLLLVAEPIVTWVSPAISVPARFALDPTCTVPKFMVAGTTEN